MIDLECMVKSLSNEINGQCKSFLQHLLSPWEVSSFWLAITTYQIIQFRLNSVTNLCLGAQSSIKLSLKKRIGQILFGTTVKLE